MSLNVADKITKEIVVFQNSPFTRYRPLTFLAGLHVVLMGFMMFTLPSRKAAKEHLEKEEERKKLVEQGIISDSAQTAGFSERFAATNFRDVFSLKTIKENFQDRPMATCTGAASMLIIAVGYGLSIRRIVHRLTLLPGGRARIETFNAFALTRPPTIELPVRNIACSLHRKSQKNFATIKVKDHMGYFMLNKQHGMFLEPKLYDDSFGFDRSWNK